MHTVLKLAQIRWTDHVIRMPDERRTKKLSMENYRRQSALKVAKRNDTKTPSKPLQRHRQSLPEGFRHTNRVLGTDCKGVIKVARSHQRRSNSLRRK